VQDDAGRPLPALTLSVPGAEDTVDLQAGALRTLVVPVVSREERAEPLEGLPATVLAGNLRLAPAEAAGAATAGGFRAGFLGRWQLAGLDPQAPVVVLVSLGPADRVDLDRLRQAVAGAVRAAQHEGTVGVLLPARLGDDEGSPGAQALVRAAAEAAALGCYRFVRHRSETDRPFPSEVRLVLCGDPAEPAALETALAQGRAVADAVWFARDLVNEPPSLLTPRAMVERVEAELAERPGVSVEVWDEERIAAEGLGGVLGVARGSAEPPRLLRLRYCPEGRDPAGLPHLAFVGKGITFDSGGLSLKTPAGMITMKTDMSGAAAVVAAVAALSTLQPPVQVTALAPLTENMPGGAAQKPGDVLQARNGKTIEVLNTDAEGRLILADALSLAVEAGAEAIVDLATLTGACVVALGNRIAGLFSNDDALADGVRRAAASAGEALWPLPLPEEYKAHIESEVADMKNVGKDGQAGAIAAALLLANFVGEVPWVHLDIAGPARSDEERGLLAKGATGFGVRTLCTWAEAVGAAGQLPG
jgi:leucyl aminopeptidase